MMNSGIFYLYFLIYFAKIYDRFKIYHFLLPTVVAHGGRRGPRRLESNRRAPRRLESNRRGPRRLESSHGGKANRRGSRKAAHDSWLVFLFFVNDLKT
jgi:hypothetical protein